MFQNPLNATRGEPVIRESLACFVLSAALFTVYFALRWIDKRDTSP